jgi:phosphatidylglycerol lysyltransferase
VRRGLHLAAGGWVRLAVLLVFAVGLVDIWSAAKAVVPERLDLLRAVVPFEYRAASRLAAGLAGFALLVLARGLARRQRNAWWLSVAVLSLGTLANLLKGLELEAAAFSLLMLGLLLLGRHQFVARHDRPTARMALRVLALAVFVTLLYGTLGYAALDREFHLRLSLPQALSATVSMFTFGAPPLPHTRLAHFFLESIYLLAAASLGTAVVMALRPVVERDRAGEPERRAAQAIVERHGRSSLAHIALLGNKQYLFTPGGSVVAYKPVGNVGLALGDPIGPDDDAAAATTAFVHFCRERAWRPVFYQVRPDARTHYQAAGLQTTLIGQQAVVALASFTLSGARNKNLRAGVNRMEREGYRVVWHDPPQPPERLHALATVSAAWLRSRHTSEKDFSLGRFDEAYIAGCPVVTVEGPDAAVLAFVNLIPEYGRSGLAVDLMRFVDGAPSETMLFLFVRLLERLREQGMERADLGLSALSGLDASARAPLTERALATVFERQRPVQLQGPARVQEQVPSRLGTALPGPPSRRRGTEGAGGCGHRRLAGGSVGRATAGARQPPARPPGRPDRPDTRPGLTSGPPPARRSPRTLRRRVARGGPARPRAACRSHVCTVLGQKAHLDGATVGQQTSEEGPMKGTVSVDESLCKGCGLCTGVCPKGLLTLSTRFSARGYHPVELSDPDDLCTGCELCSVICPEAAFTVYRERAAA